MVDFIILQPTSPLRLRPVTAADEEFLFRVYAGTRQEEVAAWGWDTAQQNAFLRMQFTAQKRSYAASYPDAEHQLILESDEPVGRIIVLKRRHGLNRCRYRGFTGMQRWVDLGVIADNIIQIGRCLALERT